MQEMSNVKISWDGVQADNKPQFFTEEGFKKWTVPCDLTDKIVTKFKELGSFHEFYWQKKCDRVDSNEGYLPFSQPARALLPFNANQKWTETQTEAVSQEGSHYNTPASSLHGQQLPHSRTWHVPYPRLSWFTKSEQAFYVQHFLYFKNHKKLNEKVLPKYMELAKLHERVRGEQQEFMDYLKVVSGRCRERYAFLPDVAHTYMQEKYEGDIRRLHTCPQFYTAVDKVPILSHKHSPHKWCHNSTVLEMGDVPVCFLTNSKTLKTKTVLDYHHLTSRYPVYHRQDSPASHQVCSEDGTAEELALKYRCDVVVSSSVLNCLVRNHSPGFKNDWDISATVRDYTTSGPEGENLHKVVYLDKPFYHSLNTRQINSKFHKISLATKILHPNHVDRFSFDPCQHLDNSEAGANIDVTDLETFGVGRSTETVLYKNEDDKDDQNTEESDQGEEDEKNDKKPSAEQNIGIVSKTSPLSSLGKNVSESDETKEMDGLEICGSDVNPFMSPAKGRVRDLGNSTPGKGSRHGPPSFQSDESSALEDSDTSSQLMIVTDDNSELEKSITTTTSSTNSSNNNNNSSNSNNNSNSNSNNNNNNSNNNNNNSNSNSNNNNNSNSNSNNNSNNSNSNSNNNNKNNTQRNLLHTAVTTAEVISGGSKSSTGEGSCNRMMTRAATRLAKQRREIPLYHGDIPLQDTPLTEVPPLQDTPLTEVPPLQDTPLTEVPPPQDTPLTEVPPHQDTPTVEVPDQDTPPPEVLPQDTPPTEVPPHQDTPSTEVPPHQDTLLTEVPDQDTLLTEVPDQDTLLTEVPDQDTLLTEVPDQDTPPVEVSPHQDTLLTEVSPLQDTLLTEVPQHQDTLLTEVLPHQNTPPVEVSPHQDTLQTEVPDRDTLQTEVPDRDTLQTEVPDRDTLQTEVPDRDTLQTEVPDRDTLQTEVPDRDTLLTEVPDRDTLLTEVPDKDTPLTMVSPHRDTPLIIVSPYRDAPSSPDSQRSDHSPFLGRETRIIPTESDGNVFVHQDLPQQVPPYESTAPPSRIEPAPQPSLKHDNVTYSVWTFSGLRVLVRCRYQAYRHKNKPKKGFVHLLPKLEYQSKFGYEETTADEWSSMWMGSLIRREIPVIKARIDAFSSDILLYESWTYNGILQHFSPVQCNTFISSVFTKLHCMKPARYLVSHRSGETWCSISVAVPRADTSLNCFDLYKKYSKNINATHPLNVPWLPLDTQLLTPYHIAHGRIPATFNPKGKRKRKGNTAAGQRKTRKDTYT